MKEWKSSASEAEGDFLFLPEQIPEIFGWS